MNGFLSSLVVHLLLLLLFLLMPTPKPPDAPLTFDVIPSASSRPQQKIVRAQNLPPDMTTTEEQNRPRFWSDKTQRVKEETRAAKSGLTKNRSASKPIAQQKNEAPKALDTQGLEQFLPNKNSIVKPSTSKRTSAQNMQESGFSTLSEDLPSEIHLGNITAVDTDHYLFYSYFSRAEELLWNEWAPMVQSVLRQPPASLKASDQRHFTTILDAWFFPDGKLHSTHILKPSGVAELDYIATTSFSRVGMIPNPPREKIDPDGLIRFKWSMTVEYDPKVLVRK